MMVSRAKTFKLAVTTFFGAILCVSGFARDLSLDFSAGLAELRAFVGTENAKIVFIDGEVRTGGDLCYIDLSESNDPPTIHRITAVQNAKVPVVSPDGNWCVYAAGTGGEAGSGTTDTCDVYIVKLEEGASPVMVNPDNENAFEPRFLQNSSELTVIYPTKAIDRQWLNTDGRTKKVVVDVSSGTPSPGSPSTILDRAFTGGISYDEAYVCGGGGTAALSSTSSDFSNVDTISRFGQACNASISASRVNTEAVMHLTMGISDDSIDNGTSYATWQVIFISKPNNNSEDDVYRYYVRPDEYEHDLKNPMSIRSPTHKEKWHHCEWSTHPYFAIATLNVERAYVEDVDGYYESGVSGAGTVYGSAVDQERIYLINLLNGEYLEVLRFADSEFVTGRGSNTADHPEILWPFVYIEVPSDFTEEDGWVSVDKNIQHRRAVLANGMSVAIDSRVISSGAPINKATVFSALGREIATIKADGKVKTLDLRAKFTPTSGVYFVRVNTTVGSAILRWLPVGE